MKLSFLGATQTVTGSKYLIESADRKVLVDCGLFQGYKFLRLKNWAPLPFKPQEIDAVVLTHAHIDHSGYLPLLVKRGFRGPIYATRATSELCRILLPDSGHLQEEQAAFANRHRFSKHHPALPLYTEVDARECLEQFISIDFDRAFEVTDDFTAIARPAGHVLGAASIRLECGGTSILFSGDVGRPNDPLMEAPAPPLAADYVVLESTYGDRSHESADPRAELGRAIRRTTERGGIVIAPTFAVGRAQLLLLLIAQLKAAGEIGDVPVYLDSPMAIDATRLYQEFIGEHRLSAAECARMCSTTRLVHTVEQSKALDRLSTPAVILAASGMATGGRVVHHLKRMAPEPRNSVLLTGFQAGGTRGDALSRGAPSLRIHGEDIPVRAEVIQISSMSAHADANELLAWIRKLPSEPRRVFVTHGEPAASDALRRRIESELKWRVSVPEYRDQLECARHE